MRERSIPTRNIPPRDTNESAGASAGDKASPSGVTEDSFYAEAAERRLTEFVDKQITKMREYASLGNTKEPTFFEVNEALMTYQDTLLALLALHNTAKIENIKAKEAFDDWYASKYILVREEVNPRNLSSQKWYSQKEIEMLVRQRYNDKYKELSWNVSMTEQQLSFLRRLLEGWNSHQYVLTQLSKNLIAEVNGMGVESALSRGTGTN